MVQAHGRGKEGPRSRRVDVETDRGRVNNHNTSHSFIRPVAAIATWSGSLY